jgi:hypothetical protein
MGDVEVARLQLEETRQQLGVVDVGAVRRIAVGPGASVHADALSISRREAGEGHVVQINEPMKQVAGGVDLDCQAGLGEVNLNLVRP